MKRAAYFCFHGGNADYFEKGLLVAVRSLKLTNPHLPVFILHDGLSSSEKEKLQGCELMKVDPSPFMNDHRSDLTIGAYFKLYAEKLADFDRVLYLDSDLVVLDSLDAIFSFKGALVARRELYSLAHEFVDPGRVGRSEGLSDKSFFLNSGVMCIDPKFWASEKLLERSLEIAKQYGWDFFKNSDQGILNILVNRYGSFTPLPIVYNYCLWPEMMCNQIQLSEKNTQGWQAPVVLSRTKQRLAGWGIPGPWNKGPLAKIVHWNGKEKPWKNELLVDKKDKYYLETYSQFITTPRH